MDQNSNNSIWDCMSKKKNKTNFKDKTVNATFQDSLRVLLILGQTFGLMPVAGIWDKNVQNLRFKILSWRFLYSTVSVMGQAFITIMCCYRIFASGDTFDGTTTIVFYLTSCASSVIFVHIARKWPELAQNIADTEAIDPNLDSTLKYRCNITCAIVMILAIVEHILSLVAAWTKALNCHPGVTGHQSYTVNSYPFVFEFMPYSIQLGLVIQLIHFQSTFVWNYSDLFVICISHCLTSRLEQINTRLRAAQGKYLLDPFWRVTREDYSRATRLVRFTDDVIGGVVLISFFNNLFFICLQLFHILEDGIKGTAICSERSHLKGPLGGYEYPIYFLFSLGFLIARSVATSLIAARVHSASLVPAPILYEVPSPVYSAEVQRFLDQVNSDNIALTGLQFFSVTRGLLLTVAGTIITYELVLVQFNNPSGRAAVIRTIAALNVTK